MGNAFGHLFRITTFGESHGGAVGVVIDGCPPRIPITVEEIQYELNRRRPGQSKLVTQRRESDAVHILSGVYDGQTLGTPICLLVWNEDARPEAYEDFRHLYRPSHADYTYEAKYGIRDWRGGGRASARETIGRVAAGAVAKKILREQGVEIVGWVEKIHTLRAAVDPNTVTLEQVEANPVRCPDPETAQAMAQAIAEARKRGDSLGGVLGCVARGVTAGWGDPVFDKLDADLAKAMLSIPAAKGFEIGSGFAGTDLTGSQHNDPFYVDETGRVRTRTNHSGGVQGGISNGENITIRVAFKPTATIMISQETVDVRRQPATLTAKGRHDPCVLPRAVPIVEAMMALVLVDHYLRHRAQCGGSHE